MKRKAWGTIVVLSLALGLPGCIFKSRSPATGSRSHASEAGPKNHGQERSAEVHERNAERKAAKDAEKDK
jgi:hypothetical protein